MERLTELFRTFENKLEQSFHDAMDKQNIAQQDKNVCDAFQSLGEAKGLQIAMRIWRQSLGEVLEKMEAKQ